jgi:hypothetical protein
MILSAPEMKSVKQLVPVNLSVLLRPANPAKFKKPIVI